MKISFLAHAISAICWRVLILLIIVVPTTLLSQLYVAGLKTVFGLKPSILISVISTFLAFATLIVAWVLAGRLGGMFSRNKASDEGDLKLSLINHSPSDNAADPTGLITFIPTDDSLSEQIKGELKSVNGNPRLATIPLHLVANTDMSPDDIQNLCTQAGFDFTLGGIGQVLSGAHENRDVLLPKGWTYSSERWSGITDAEGELIAQNQFIKPDHPPTNWIEEQNLILRPLDSPNYLLFDLSRLNYWIAKNS